MGVLCRGAFASFRCTWSGQAQTKPRLQMQLQMQQGPQGGMGWWAWFSCVDGSRSAARCSTNRADAVRYPSQGCVTEKIWNQMGVTAVITVSKRASKKAQDSDQFDAVRSRGCDLVCDAASAVRDCNNNEVLQRNCTDLPQWYESDCVGFTSAYHRTLARGDGAYVLVLCAGDFGDCRVVRRIFLHRTSLI